MIGLDTNIIVRYLVQDDPSQSRIANLLFEQLTQSRPGFVSIVAMAETAWVLERVYAFSDRQIATVIESMLRTEALTLECEQQVFAAMTVLKAESGSFSDALIAALGARAGCSSTLTFDRKAARLAGFKLLFPAR